MGIVLYYLIILSYLYLQYYHNTVIPSYIDILIIIIMMNLQEIKLNTHISNLFFNVMIINLVHSSFVLPIYLLVFL